METRMWTVAPGIEIRVEDTFSEAYPSAGSHRPLPQITAKVNGVPIRAIVDVCLTCHRFDTQEVVVHSLDEAAELGWIEWVEKSVDNPVEIAKSADLDNYG